MSYDRGSDAVRARPTYLNEIQGLRAVAALLVALYHIWFQRVSGGVDVFFVVASYFMVRSLAKFSVLEWTHVQKYYLSTLRRVVPGLAAVVIATIAMIILLPTASNWRSELAHAIASLLFLENWNLAWQATDYLSQDLRPSAFQQMWALSLQVQLYAIIPALMFACGTVARRRGVPIRTIFTLLFLSMFFVSLAWSVLETSTNQPRAYFDTFARIWEFSAGALLALHIDRIHLSRLAARGLGLLALAVLLTFAAFLDVSRLFPGYVAAVPVCAALSIIISAQNSGSIFLLTWRPVVQAGDYSFSFYLWHWPILVVTRQLLGGQVGLIAGFGILALSAALAWVTTRWIEAPFRRSEYLSARPTRAAIACAFATIPAFLAISGAWTVYRSQEFEARKAVAAVLSGRPLALPDDTIVPAPVLVLEDLPPVYEDHCHQDLKKAELIECVYGDKDSRETVVLVGGSHAAQWLSPLELIARDRNIRIVNITKSGCFFTLDKSLRGEAGKSCSTWNEKAVARILDLKPQLVVTISTRVAEGREDVPLGYVAAWRTLENAGIPILGLRDNPRFLKDPVMCAETHVRNYGACGITAKSIYVSTDPAANVRLSNLKLVDFSNEYCPAGMCPVVSNGILRYRDTHHLTATYTMTFKDRLAKALDEALSTGRKI